VDELGLSWDERSQRKREAVLEATVCLLRTRPVSAISIDAVAERAEVSRGTIYRYFGSRERLFQYAVEAALDETRVECPDPHETAVAALHRLARAWTENAVSDARLCALRVRCAWQGVDSSLLKENARLLDGQRSIRECLERLASEGMLMLPDIGGATRALLGLLCSPLLERRLLLAIPLSSEEIGAVVREAVDFIFRIFGTRGEGGG
jgi:TetR/AcrR family transcriptional regulator, regulator of autoinduction and epiphytic fitness